nr:bifunctional aspartate aminotransferase and glutamate/aspartate-prephenate aminotransferase-like [Penaeus vannamei]
MADKLVGSEIIKLAGEIKAKIAGGEPISNLTIGDFNPGFFPIPKELKEEIINCYQDDVTNYPAANGMVELRESVSEFLKEREELTYSADELLIAGGARPLIYAAYRALIDPEDKVLFPVPSWNNNHYSHLTAAQQIIIETVAENNFMPTAQEIKPYISDLTMIALCSPLNPTGTVFSVEQLKGICELILEENKKRKIAGVKPLYILFDQIYWLLTYGETSHTSPVNLFPELKDYTIYIDGLSKAFAATGVRVGWGFGPQAVINKMKSILGHVGAWAPKAEQIAVANYLKNKEAVNSYLSEIKSNIELRLNKFYEGFLLLKGKGYSVDVIAPQAAIYLTVKFDLIGKKTAEGEMITTTSQITQYILNETKLGIVPFYSFGTDRDSTWYRLSVGTANVDNIEAIFKRIEEGLDKLQ